MTTETKKKTPRKLKKKHKIIIGIILLLVGIRLVLPYFITKKVNEILAKNIEPYKGHIYDIDLSLYRGAYRICDMKVDLIDENGKNPFVYAPHIDLSIQWKSLFKGSLVGEVVMESPEINFKLAPKGEKMQTGEEADWVQLVKDLMPIEINRFAIKDGQVGFFYLDGKAANFNVEFENFDLEVKNIRNVEEKDKALPSTVVATANAPGYGGAFNLTAEAMLLKEMPDFNYNMKFESAELKSMNEIFRYMTGGMDFERGKLNMYSEMAMKDGTYKGYLKPILLDAKIFKWKEEDRSFKNGVKELLAEGVQEIFENHKKDQSATRVPIEGTVKGPQRHIWPVIVAAFTNAYVKAFQFQLDNSIDYKNAFKDDENKDKKEDKKDKERKKK